MQKRRQRAFTLIEVLIVIAIMGIFAALAIPSAAPNASEQLQAAGDMIIADLDLARSLAVVNNSTYQISYDPSRNSYVLRHTGVNPTLDDLPEHPFIAPGGPSDSRTIDLDDIPSFGATVSLHDVYVGGAPAAFNDVEFTALGSTQRAAETQIWLTAGVGKQQRFLSVDVNPVTGLATLGQMQATTP